MDGDMDSDEETDIGFSNFVDDDMHGIGDMDEEQ